MVFDRTLLARLMIKRLTPFVLVISYAAIAFSGSDLHAQKRSRATSKTEGIQQKFLTAEAGDTVTTMAKRIGVNPLQVARLNGLSVNTKLKKGQQVKVPSRITPEPTEALTQQRQPNGKLIKFDDGSTFHVDDAWWRGEEVWYTLGKVTASAPRKVKTIETVYVAQVRPNNEAVIPPKIVPQTKSEAASSTWIFLHGGAKLKVDQVKEQADGAWYQRGNLLSFLDRTRISRIERDVPDDSPSDWKERGWTSGNAMIDGLIRTNGSRYGVDPYLVFLVIEQESHFRTRAVSPKGARGLMQLMPGTARRFGVAQSFDPVQNIRGGTQYLKELLGMFNGRVDLALASYNAGEGRVIQYGNKVPPFRETREYVKRIGSRYGSGADEQRSQRKPRAGE